MTYLIKREAYSHLLLFTAVIAPSTPLAKYKEINDLKSVVRAQSPTKTTDENWWTVIQFQYVRLSIGDDWRITCRPAKTSPAIMLRRENTPMATKSFLFRNFLPTAGSSTITGAEYKALAPVLSVAESMVPLERLRLNFQSHVKIPLNCPVYLFEALIVISLRHSSIYSALSKR